MGAGWFHVARGNQIQHIAILASQAQRAIVGQTWDCLKIGHHKGPCLKIIFPTALPSGVTLLDRATLQTSSGSLLLSPSSP